MPQKTVISAITNVLFVFKIYCKQNSSHKILNINYQHAEDKCPIHKHITNGSTSQCNMNKNTAEYFQF
jgi:hypothetical protein